LDIHPPVVIVRALHTFNGYFIIIAGMAQYACLGKLTPLLLTAISNTIYNHHEKGCNHSLKLPESEPAGRLWRGVTFVMLRARTIPYVGVARMNSIKEVGEIPATLA